MKHYDVIIIGGGVVGLSSAYYLGKAGKSVLVLEKGDGTDGCSFGNAGFIAPSHFVPLSAPGIVSKGLRWMFSSESPFYIKPRLSKQLIRWGWEFMNHATDRHVNDSKKILAELALLSRDLHIEIAKEGNLDLQQKGIVMLCNTEEGFKHEIEIGEMASGLGMEAHVLSMKELNKLDPNTKKNGVGGVYFPMDAYTDPAVFMNKLAELLNIYDVIIEYQSGVEGFELNNGAISSVSVGEKQFSADHYIMAAGSYSTALMKKLNLNLLLEPGKGYSADWTKPTSIPSLSYILVEKKVAITPFKDRMRFVGTLELSGINEKIDFKRAHGFLKSIESYFPEYQFEKIKDLKIWAGLRPCSPDGLPYIGRSKMYSNLILATGHAMLGFTLGPVTGQLVKEIVLEEKTSLNIEKLSVNRY